MNVNVLCGPIDLSGGPLQRLQRLCSRVPAACDLHKASRNTDGVLEPRVEQLKRRMDVGGGGSRTTAKCISKK